MPRLDRGISPGTAASPIKFDTGDAIAVSNQPENAARSGHNRRMTRPCNATKSVAWKRDQLRSGKPPSAGLTFIVDTPNGGMSAKGHTVVGHHHHVEPDASDARVFWAVIVNVCLTVAQIIGGILSGSLALIADAIHNLSDALSLAIAFFARKIARRPSDAQMTFGYGRAEVVAALVNYTTLIVIGLYLVYEAVLRFAEPQGIDGWLVVVIAGIALAVDLVTALLTYSLSKHSLNIRAAFLHNMADALGSIAVIFAGTLILLYDWRLIDPLVTLMIAGYILWQSFTEIEPVIRILMLGSPPDIDTSKVLDRMRATEGIEDIHHLHLWQMEEHENALDAHLVISRGAWSNADQIKECVKGALKQDFGISHSTLEMECSAHACTDPEIIGH